MPNSFSRPKSPSLNALKAFEAAARHQSFVKAAHELNVTAGAIAQQVKQLEDWIGCPLFQRSAQGIKLTPESQLALPILSKAFDQLSVAVMALHHAGKPTEVTIAALPSVALLWLSPRLPRLSAMFPDYYFSITAQEYPPNFRREPFDLALFYTDKELEGVTRIPLGKEELLPVCAPSVLPNGRASAADLQSARLLHDTVWRDYWPLWLDFAEIPFVDVSKGSEFSLYSMALQAAIDGAGVLIGRSGLVRNALAAGQLVEPFGLRMPAPNQLSLLVPDESPLLRNADLLVECLKL
ncbi:MAG TPA: LysR substrate-binding domain-containing protein [Candidimonas sp.]|nr:LysR substrate-binding domain-containing protein [Candidimonas sp.]